MDDNGSKKTMRELRGRINRFIRLTLNDIMVEAKDEFDMNFKREAFFTEKWKRRKGDTDETRGLLVQSGTLRRSIRSRIMEGGKGVEITSSVPYAKIHNEGGKHHRHPQDEGIFLDKVQAGRGRYSPDKGREGTERQEEQADIPGCGVLQGHGAEEDRKQDHDSQASVHRTPSGSGETAG